MNNQRKMKSRLLDSGCTSLRSLKASRPCHLFLASLLLCAPLANVSANNIAVNTNIPDISIGDGKCSLIEAINEAQAPGSGYGDCPPGSNESDTITLEASGPYSLTSVNNNTDGPNGLPSITTEITINGNGEVIEKGYPTFEPPLFRIFHVGLEGTLSLNQLTVKGGLTVDFVDYQEEYPGAGIYNNGKLTVSNCRLSDNYAGEFSFGGGVFNTETGTVDISNSVVDSNSPDAIVSWGLATIRRTTVNFNGGDGSGTVSNFGDMEIADSLIYNNWQVTEAGGIEAIGASAKLVVVNTTVTENYSDMMAGGIAVINGAATEIISSTIADNESSSYSSQLEGHADYGSSVVLRNTVLYSVDLADPLCRDINSRDITSMGYNVASDGSCNLTGTGDQPYTDPLLGDLADNGGPTLTRALLHGSPAIDAGETNCTDTEAAPLLTDQRGMSRPADGNEDGFAACDVGAYEMQPLPTAPTIGTATPGDKSAIVAFIPGDLGSGTLIYYKAKCGNKTATGTSSPIIVTGLTNGTTYTCKVRTTTSVGNSPSSAESNAVTPSAGGITLPTAPTIGTATPGNARAIVAFTPGALGSGTLINYTAKCGAQTATGTSSPLGVAGLTNGTTYTCQVKTTSSVGDSPWSASSNSVTPSASVPDAPTIGTATPGNASVSVAFTPGALGSGTLINYTANCGSFTATGTSSPITVTGLTNGTAYTCKVRTSSSVGDSLWSANSNSVTPSGGGNALPAAPTIGIATPGNKSASVAFTPGNLGSGALVYYKAKCGTHTATGTSSPIIVTGLTNGTAYTCKVRTTSSVGNSPSSALSNSVTPSAGGSALPAAPTIGTATPGNKSASVAFTPGNLGSGALVYYKAKCGTHTATGTSSPIIVTGLTNGTTYTCKVRTTSSVGNSPSSALSNSVTPSAAAR